jgi:hypothetical protein
MLVTCATCGVSFDPALRRCVSCGEDYVFTTTEETGYLENRVWVKLEAGELGSAVRQWLMEEKGLDQATAETILQGARDRIRRQPRHTGLIMLAAGTFLAIGVYNHSVFLGDLFVTLRTLAQILALASFLLITGGLVKYLTDAIRVSRALWRCDH